MSGKHRPNTGILWIVLLVLAGLACALPGGGSDGVAPPAPTGGGASPASDGGSGVALPTATPANAITYPEGAAIDLCALATPAEVQAVLGGPATRAEWFAGGQNCTLFLDDDHFMIVQAGHDADGKTLHLGGMSGFRFKVTDPAALQLYDDLTAQQASLTLPELVERALPFWRAAGFVAEKEEGVGDWAVWFFGYQDAQNLGALGQFGTGRASGKWVSVYMSTTDPEAAKALLKPLAAALLDRLPDNFTVTGNNY